MPENDQVASEVESPAEAAPLPEEGTEQTSEPVTEPASPDESGTTAETGPEVDYKAKYEEALAGYREQQGLARQHESELQRYRDAEAQARAEILKDKDKYIDEISDPDKGPALFRRLVQDALNERDSLMRQKDVQIEAQRAFNELRDFALKDAKMSSEEFEVFIHQNRDANGIPFGGYDPQRALRIGKALIRDSHHEYFSQQVHQKAAEAADAKAKQKLQKQVAPATSVGIQTDDNKTPEEKWKEKVLGPIGSESIENFLPDD